MKIFVKLFSVIILALLILVFAGSVTRTQATSDDMAKKYGITFPVTDLGGCADLDACRSYCQDPANQTRCMEFAKKKGFYKETSSNSQEILKRAKEELGCDSTQACKDLCTTDANFEKCNNFAKKYSLGGGVTQNPTDAQILQKAKETLGCDSYKSCFLFCSQDANRQKCSEFAKKVSLRGGAEIKGPGDCTSESSCRSYCQDPANFNICSKYVSTTYKKNFKGPGGCDSTQSCQAFCQEHPDVCKKYSQTTQTNFQPRPDMGNCQTASQCYEWCKANPDKCKKLQNYSPPPNSTSTDKNTQSASPSVHGVKTGPADWVNQTIDSVINFLAKLF